jgi:hypothetical protein
MIDEPSTTIETPGEKQPSQSFWQKNKVGIILGGIGLALVLVLGLTIFGLTRNASVTAMIRDIAIICLAVISGLIGIALIVLIYQIAMLTLLLRDEIKPLLESANETMDTLRGTTVFMSENIVEPAIKASSTVSGVRRVLEVLVGLRPSAKRKP